MKLSPIHQKTNQNFKGILNNKAILYGLEKISEHGATFAAATSFIAAGFLRPLAISLTPKTNEENKKYACSSSIASGLSKLAIASTITLPIEHAIKKIDNEPQKFLKDSTINNLKNSASSLLESKDYKFATQLLKQSTTFLTIIPKSTLTIALIPLIMDLLFKNKKDKQKEEVETKKQELPFKGGLEKLAGKILNNNSFQNIVKKYSDKNTDIARNTAVSVDVLLTLSSILKTKKSKKIDENRKKPLIFNSIFSTSASILLGCSMDEMIKKGTKNFIEKFKQANINNPKLAKYIEGINIVRPTMIFALIYYGILPVVTTFISDKMPNLNDNKVKEQNLKL